MSNREAYYFLSFFRAWCFHSARVAWVEGSLPAHIVREGIRRTARKLYVRSTLVNFNPDLCFLVAAELSRLPEDVGCSSSGVVFHALELQCVLSQLGEARSASESTVGVEKRGVGQGRPAERPGMRLEWGIVWTKPLRFPRALQAGK